MSIDRTQPLNPASTVQSRDTSDTAAPKARQAETTKATSTPTASQVVLSDAQSQLTKSSAQDINTERVEQLKTAIRNGGLKMDTGKIADALIQQAKDSLEGN
ncbi:anti-sigma-28 factor FlgM [Erwinia tracheiphila]|uniref:Negative regulator of flagellin synthesis n=1 Tax=Erwinia tracheiphila TaxID=65700 RepID=A0A0M2K652_9GAMM|nr:flagellar biosynthesis anti-sigma factor FlgM [Erwinia tracheiphila]AXF76139.1 anti-sigma-28 factor FlgM [Erwinia tracheiphila]EOS96689.1 Negative regulator of flagellin synthesis [Erwinia tracheiphila PSU-1]KKF34865.1 flagellar biosynthesis anti-sigma factor FlgM [Erwinia tracheiphila]UIA85193.1 anti-sigma-28 factor FlgM [Erwinia tracheiphila]UIA86532.1 anti-sigma-28 factor FlgM [Erwinia tracheiphila]